MVISAMAYHNPSFFLQTQQGILCWNKWNKHWSNSPFSSSATFTPTVVSIDTGIARNKNSDRSCCFFKALLLSRIFLLSRFFLSCCSSRMRLASQGQSGGWLEGIPTAGEGRVKSTLGGGTFNGKESKQKYILHCKCVRMTFLPLPSAFLLNVD